MKRISIQAMTLTACLMPLVWAQQNTGAPRFDNHSLLRQRIMNRMANTPGAASNPGFMAPAASAASLKTWDLGHYPGGTWAEPVGLNDFGVAVGWGDVPGGYDHPIGVPLSGRDAGRWFDLGTLGGDRTDEQMCMGVADTGMIVGHAALPGGEIIHAFAWTASSGMVDIGALSAELNFSLALNVNKSGTLIVGFSSNEFFGPANRPVVWTPKIVWGPHGPAINWTIQELDRTGFEQATNWFTTAVNDLGQITGTATGPDGNWMALLWNPLPGQKGWKIMQLPSTPDFPYASPPADINDKGEIVGWVARPDWSALLPALWKPMDPQKSTYSLTRLPSLTGSDQGSGAGSGINDLGDIVGSSTDADGNGRAVRWSTRDLSYVALIGFPGTWSFAARVNDAGIAVGAYGSDTIPENVVAGKLH